MEHLDASTQDIPAAVHALRCSFKSGATKELATRKRLLLQILKLINEGHERLTSALWKDLHKNPVETNITELNLIRMDIQENLDYMKDWSTPKRVHTDITNIPGFSYIAPEPYGVVCIFGTWNYPYNLLFGPLVAAIAAGNCALVRLPSDDTVRHTTFVLKSLFDQYLDPRYIRYVYGGIPESKLVLEQRYDMIFATGSSNLGKIVSRAAAEYLTPVVLELGGKSFTIVDETADVELAARRIIWGTFINAGQTCIRPDYVLIHKNLAEKFIQNVKKMIESFYSKNPATNNAYGRIVNRQSYDRLVNILKGDQKYIVHGGDFSTQSPTKEEESFYIAPTIMDFKDNFQAFKDSAVMQGEVFGPILPIAVYNLLDEAIEYVNEHEKALVGYVFTTSSHVKHRLKTETSSGSLVFNDTMMQMSNPSLPFGGVGNSGYGRYHGFYGFETFSHYKSILYKYSLLDLPFRYPPYTSLSIKLQNLFQYPVSRFQLRMVKTLGIIALLITIRWLWSLRK